MKIIENINIDIDNHDRTRFIRIDPEDLSITIAEIIYVLSDLSWINKFDSELMKKSLMKRGKPTADSLAEKIKLGVDNKVTKDAGESIVSELAREAMVNELGYLNVPLAEIFKEQVSGNSGFDIYSGTIDKLIVFGEAKYVSSSNAYGKSMEQVDRFINEEQDIADYYDIKSFYTDDYEENMNNGKKAYAVAFSSKSTSSETIIKGIMNNKHYKSLSKQTEIIYVAVNV